MGNKSSKPNPTPKAEGGGANHDDTTSCVAVVSSSQPPKADGATTFYTAADRLRTLLLCSMRAQNQQSKFQLSLMYRERSIALRILHYVLCELEACLPMTQLRQQLVS